VHQTKGLFIVDFILAFVANIFFFFFLFFFMERYKSILLVNDVSLYVLFFSDWVYIYTFSAVFYYLI